MPVTCAPASGGSFLVGMTTVKCSATDAHGNIANGSFRVTVSVTITGNHTGGITVGAGQNMLVSPGAVVTGPVTVQAGGSLDVEGAKITGSLTATSAGTITACGSTITGPVAITADTGQVTFGDGRSCAGNKITGQTKITAGIGTGVTFYNNTATGSLTITHNRGRIDIGRNKVTGTATLTPSP